MKTKMTGWRRKEKEEEVERKRKKKRKKKFEKREEKEKRKERREEGNLKSAECAEYVGGVSETVEGDEVLSCEPCEAFFLGLTGDSKSSSSLSFPIWTRSLIFLRAGCDIV